MDSQEQLILDSTISVAVLGKGEEFVLIRLDVDELIDDSAFQTARDRGYFFCGVLGLQDGQAGARCEPDPDSIYTMLQAGLAFSMLVAEQLRTPPKGDSVEWLDALYNLPGREDPKV